MGCGVPDNATGRAVAKRKASQIELDLQAGYFDPTLLKYKPRISGKSATEINAPELFARYVQVMKSEKGLSAGSLRRYQGCGYHLRQ
jgi:integrase